MARQPAGRCPADALVETEAGRLAELRLDATELRIRAELACGGHSQVIPELRRLLADHPLREGLWLLLMRALDGAGLHAEALDAYGQARSAIADELGVDPGAELRQFYAGLLAEDDLLAKDGRRRARQYLGGDGDAELRGAGGRPGHRPRSRGLVPVPAQLPADVADFTGRDDQVKHLCDMLSSDGRRRRPRGGPHRAGGRLRRAGQDLPGRACGPPGPRPASPTASSTSTCSARPRIRSRAADVLARFLRDLGVDGRDIPARRGRARGPLPDRPGRAPDARRARQRP